MSRAIWNDVVVAESDRTVVVEGNHYFPREAVKAEFLVPSETTSVCPWKGTASYYSLEVGDKRNADAAWFYADPKDTARHIVDHVAFWKGVIVE